MRKYIAINAAGVGKPNKTGVEWYALQLLKYLAREWQDSDPQIVLFAPQGTEIPKFHKSNWGIKHLPGKRLWTQHHLRKFLKRYPPALLFSPSYVAPRFLPKKIKTINVVHGLEGEHFPEFRSLKDTLRDYLINIPTLKRSTAIIAVSKHTRIDLIFFYGIPATQIHEVLSGRGTLDDNFAPRIKKGRKKIKFFLLAGANDRKNLPLALKIFSALQESTPEVLELTIAGNIVADKNRRLMEKTKNIHYLGYIDETNKIEQLLSSHFLLYSSFYEGFGFPVLEAQACGALPIVLEGSGLNEVGGEGIVEYNPLNEKASLGRIIELIQDRKQYSQLRKIGLKNTKRFSWQACARDMRNILLKFI